MVNNAPNEEKVVVIRLGDEEYGVDILVVAEIIRPTEITPLPRAPKSVVGLINLRGKVIPVIDARERFDLPKVKSKQSERIVILSMDDGQLIGVRVDAATEILTLGGDEIGPAPDLALSDGIKEAIRAVANRDDRLIILLNPEKILPPSELEQTFVAAEEHSAGEEAEVE
ncbi:MAG: chemotaxis protein CheW [Actinobacteria bacterium]|nr:chemotaxis protein CheW [Actinomycetota bacterium]